MALYDIKYQGPDDRRTTVHAQQDFGHQLMHDNFDANWKRGDTIHGTLVFSDDPVADAPSLEEYLPGELEAIEAQRGRDTRVAELRVKVMDDTAEVGELRELYRLDHGMA